MKSPLGYSMFGYHIPEHMAGGVVRYIMTGVIPGDFLQAVICDSLKGCVSHADDKNLPQLPAYVYYFYNEAPMACYGSKERMKEWNEIGGLEGLEQQHEKEQEKQNEGT